ncbi:hypothetical protein BDZ91DRAFT_721211 [Kalaharituber pfeilii]|nr:hypothetical protein BDZ91DRAFT_721211 [Kalaharituber pfeilii]
MRPWSGSVNMPEYPGPAVDGWLNGLQVCFYYHSASPSEGAGRGDFQSGLHFHTPDKTLSSFIPTPDIIVLLDTTQTDNNGFLLLYSGKEFSQSEQIPNLVPGRLQIIGPPQALKDAFLFNIKQIPDWLDVDGGKSDVTVILSTGAGSNGSKSNASELYDRTVKTVLHEIGFHEKDEVENTPDHITNFYSVIRTTSEETIKNFAAELFSKSASSLPPRKNQTIILLSGDTSLFELINAIPTPFPSFAPKLRIALLPTGTGNALASSTHLSYHPISALLLGSPHALPLFHANFSPDARLLTRKEKQKIPQAGLYGAVVLSWAFHASLVADSDTPAYREKYPGLERFKVAARENLQPALHLYKGRVSVQRHPNSAWEDLQKELAEQDRGYLYFLATLVSRLEATFLINPLGMPLDGLLRVVNFGKLPMPAISVAEAQEMGAKSVLQAMEAAYDNGKHVELPGVGYERNGVEGVKVWIDEEDYVDKNDTARGVGRWRRICIDGAIVEMGKGGWIEVNVLKNGLDGLKILWRS